MSKEFDEFIKGVEAPNTYKVDTWTSFHHDKERIINAQISDKEIEEAAPQGNLTLEEGFIRGAKWYREQLKQRQ
jgi:hypothetical protein